MKRIHLIEFGIIIVALIFGYKFFEGVFSLLTQIFYGFTMNDNEIFASLLPTILICVAYLIFFIALIRQSNQLAKYLGKNIPGEQVPIKVGKAALLDVVLISICLVTILANIADILIALYETFKHEVGRKGLVEEYIAPTSQYYFKVAAVKTIVALVVLYFAKHISGWFIRKAVPDELTFESEAQKDQ